MCLQGKRIWLKGIRANQPTKQSCTISDELNCWKTIMHLQGKQMRLWDKRYSQPTKQTPIPNPLPSDAFQRKDLIVLKQVCATTVCD